MVDVHGKPQVGEPPEQRGEDRAEFGAGEARTDAEVPAVAEGDVRVWVTRGVEPLGIRKHRRILVSRGHGDDDRFTTGDGLTGDLDVLMCVARYAQATRGSQ